ncbi:HK97 family phage prohead protease [Chthonobacter rhizosphaerae]|uniref:HK97 family phage prohead protease n=1 Tax=Chthonobacter rhizosphaerae TaxID=2735553 RepID=UPI0015EFAF30|nr:HK97 family phage prohead protease [Chthonobacter rhizosphaerae]
MSAAASTLSRREAGRGVFQGYASLFGVTDLTGDMVLPGAFAATLARRGAAGVKLLYQHDPAEPIGRWLDIRETDRGLRVTGQILADTVKGRDAVALIETGILDGLSIGFRTVRARTDRKTGVRRVAEVDLWEISVVTFPMLPGARIDPPAAASALLQETRAAGTAETIRRAARAMAV